MDSAWIWINENYQWLFSGAGIAAFGFLFKKLFTRRNGKDSDTDGVQITTAGDFSPGKVGRDYVIQEAQKPKKPKKY